ncbi:MAG: hypothetical protein WD425_01475 [Nitrospirales bacterium]
MAFQYQHRFPFEQFSRLTQYEIDEIDHFLELANEAHKSKQSFLAQLGSSENVEELSDWLADDFAQLDTFTSLMGEFAILGLWRCVELYRKRSIGNALGKNAAKGVFNHKCFKLRLANPLQINEENIQHADLVNELRCLNNAIKHERCVTDELSTFELFKNMIGADLGDLRPHYQRLLPKTKEYIKDLTQQLNLAEEQGRITRASTRTT